MYLLDTDILSNLMKRSPSVPLLAKLASVPPRQQHTSSVTLGELIYGANRLRQRSTKLLDQIDKLVANLPVLPFDAAAARRYGGFAETGPAHQRRCRIGAVSDLHHSEGIGRTARLDEAAGQGRENGRGRWQPLGRFRNADRRDGG